METDPTPVLVTERLVLRLAREEDAAEIARYYRKNAAHLQPTHPLLGEEMFTEGYWRERAGMAIRELHQGWSARFFLFAKEAPETVVGVLNLNDIRRGATQSCALGYSLAAEAQGNGSMTEAVRAAVEYAFGDLNLHRVQAAYMPGNARSGRVLRRLGFIVEGYARDYLRVAGRWEDHILASRTNEAWRE